MTAEVCDTCLTAVYDEFLVSDRETQDDLARELGLDMGDHNCDSAETGEPCGCGCQT